MLNSAINNKHKKTEKIVLKRGGGGASVWWNDKDELDELHELIPGVWAEEDGAPQEGVQGGGQCAGHCSLIFILFKL